MKTNPYETTIGRLYNVDKLKETFSLFLINHPENLNYEYANGNKTKLVFITGKNEDEKDLPILVAPFFMENFRGMQYLIIDLRAIVNANKDFDTLASIVRDKNGYMFLITLTILTLENIDEEHSQELQMMGNNLVAGFVAWIGSIFNLAFMLNVEEKLNLYIVLGYYYLSLLFPEMDTMAKANRITNLKLIPIKDKKYVLNIIENLKKNIETIDDLVEIIHEVNVSEKMKHLTSDVIFNIISTSWYGPNSKEMLLLATEHAPTLASLIYVNMENSSYKKSKLANILKNNSRSIDAKNIKLTVEETIKKYLIM